ncbi:penicillin-insensitive murein endopeptidase [Bartonella tamiae]
MKKTGYKSSSILLLGLIICVFTPVLSKADEPAKDVFGSQIVPSLGATQSIGFYSKGCLAGGVALPLEGPNWQVMRPSRHRNWAHPAMIKFLENLSKNAAKNGWRGLLIGDISQPLGGPMLNGHASHQVGLDADIWFTPMPQQRLNLHERETLQGISMLKPKSLYIDPKKWSFERTALLHLAANDPEVDRIFVHPGIKKHLCESVKGDRKWLSKIRPYYGHYWHFHVRMKCQNGSPQCQSQPPITKDDGCDKSLEWWFSEAPWKPQTNNKRTTPSKPYIMTVKDLPQACQQLVETSKMKNLQNGK